MHKSSYLKMEAFREKYLSAYEKKRLTIVDLGSQDVNGTYRDIFDSPFWEYRGADMVAGDNVDIVLSDIYNWKEIPTDSVDVFISGQTFEHIEYIWDSMREVQRVLKPGGLCCIIAPSGGVEHKHPVDCWRIYPDGFKVLARYAGLETLEVYTQWESFDFPDGSDIWKDSVLVAEKKGPMLARRLSRRKGRAMLKDIFCRKVEEMPSEPEAEVQPQPVKKERGSFLPRLKRLFKNNG